MKKSIYCILALLILTIPAYATDYTAKFEWQQATKDLPSLEKWSIKIRSESGGGIEKVIDITYDGSAGPDFTASEDFVITGAPGEVITKFAALTATSKNGNETSESNELPLEFVIPYNDVTTPVSFTITITIKAE